MTHLRLWTRCSKSVEARASLRSEHAPFPASWTACAGILLIRDPKYQSAAPPSAACQLRSKRVVGAFSSPLAPSSTQSSLVTEDEAAGSAVGRHDRTASASGLKRPCSALKQAPTPRLRRTGLGPSSLPPSSAAPAAPQQRQPGSSDQPEHSPTRFTVLQLHPLARQGDPGPPSIFAWARRSFPRFACSPAPNVVLSPGLAHRLAQVSRSFPVSLPIWWKASSQPKRRVRSTSGFQLEPASVVHAVEVQIRLRACCGHVRGDFCAQLQSRSWLYGESSRFR